MRSLKSISNRLRNLLRKHAVERETDQELRFHLERQVATNIAAGLSPEEARRAALLEFGGVEQFKEDCREARGVNRIESLFADLRYGFRTLRKSPGFAIVSVLTLALGIGANTAILSMVNALLLHPYNFRNLDALVRVWEDHGIDEGYDARYIAPADAEDLRSTNDVFEGLTTYRFQSFGLGTQGDVQPILGCRVSANFFEVLAVSAAAGRLFNAAEEQPGADQVAILSYGSWQSRFAGDPRLLGKTLSLNGRVYAVVGIMPKDFDYPVPVELWVPLALTPAEKADQGFEPASVLRIEISLPQKVYADNVEITNFYQQVLRGAASLPGVQHASLVTNPPASNVDNETAFFSIEGQPALKASETPSADLQIASPDFFDTLKISSVEGRVFSDADNADAARVVVISRGMAARFWPKGDAPGHRIKLGAQDSTEPWLAVVGVVGDVRQNWWNPITRPVIYKPFAQSPQRSMTLLLRTTPNPPSYVSGVREVVRQIDPGIALRGINTLEEEVADSIAIVRIMGILMGIFGLVALSLSSIGVYGVLSESVAQRTHEIGIRLALGANQRDLMKLILGQALKLTGIGLAIAVPCAVAIGRAMGSLIFGVVRLDFAMVTGFTALLLLVALGAGYLPARRAIGVDPVVSLRYE